MDALMENDESQRRIEASMAPRRTRRKTTASRPPKSHPI